MPNIDYLKIFRDAGKIAWKNRFLWWFGLFMLLPGITNIRYSPQSKDAPQGNWQVALEKLHLQEFLSSHTAFIAVTLSILSILFLIFLVFSFVN